MTALPGLDLFDSTDVSTKSRIELQIELNYEVSAPGADFVFNLHAARTDCQILSSESLVLSQDLELRKFTDPGTGNRHLCLRARPGLLKLSYAVVADIRHHRANPADLLEVPIHQLPPAVIPYIYPSRYCQSDRLLRFAADEFGHLDPGHCRVQAIRDWVFQHVRFRANSSDGNTSAIDTLVERVGVCRDFAHLMIALCRAVSIPARFATSTDFGADPALGPPDFHACVEAYLGGRWYIFDPSGTAIPMGFVRFGTGRDAADVAFATMFGPVVAHTPLVRALAVGDDEQAIVLPHHVAHAISTDSGLAGSRIH